MPGPLLEVADIFRAHGAAYRAAKTGHISLTQLKVMNAIERCRTAALGGHIARCADCAHEHIAYNSCRNRHCPKCQAGAAKAWLVAREGAGRHTTMTLATSEFIRRFLIHVLPRGQHRIRHYSFYGNGTRAANIIRIRQLLGAKTPDQSRDDDGNHGNSDEPTRVLALPCPCCGGQLIIVETIAPEQYSRAPPKPQRAAA